jgi:hypothetical protein
MMPRLSVDARFIAWRRNRAGHVLAAKDLATAWGKARYLEIVLVSLT